MDCIANMAAAALAAFKGQRSGGSERFQGALRAKQITQKQPINGVELRRGALAVAGG
jgi:hypothetical protein